MSLFNSRSLTILRYEQTWNAITGKNELLFWDDFSIKGTWQPSNGKQKELLPEGMRSRTVYTLYTKTDLFLKSDPDNISFPGIPLFSRVQIDSQIWSMEVDANWNNGILPHHEYVCLQEAEISA